MGGRAMNRHNIPALVALILALTIAIGSQTFMGACVHADGIPGACHWAGRAILGAALLLAALAAAALVWPVGRPGLYGAMAAACGLGLSIPGGLIGICGAVTMRCRMVMQPASRLLFALALLAAAAGLLLARGRAKP